MRKNNYDQDLDNLSAKRNTVNKEEVPDRPVYEKNKEYDQEAFNRMFDMWKLARSMGNQRLAQEQINMIYQYCYKFVYKELWKRYPSLMNSAKHQQDLIQEVWLKLLEQLPNYDYTKAGITTFIALWIPHVGTSYYSESFSYTSNYFSEAMSQVNAAENYLRLHNIDMTLDILMRITGLPEVTIVQAQELLRRKGTVPIDEMVIEQPSRLPTPEATVLQNEATASLNSILKKELNEEEILVIQFMISPRDERKDIASYGEVVENMNNYMLEHDIPQKYNVPKVKKIMSKVCTKIINNKDMSTYFPQVVNAYRKMGGNGNMPILDDHAFLKEQEKALLELFEEE